MADKKWRLSHLYKISNKDGNLVTFTRNRMQADYASKVHTRNILLKSRQLGGTTDGVIDSLDDTLWTEGFKSLIISYDQVSALEIFDSKVKLAWEHYPEVLRGLYEIDTQRANKLKFGFGNGQYSEFLVRNRGRSGTFNRVHISEFAKICRDSRLKAREIITGTIPAVPFNGRIDIESTAEGEEGEFHDMFWEAWNRGEPTSPLQWKAHFYNWTWDDEEIAKAPIIPVPTEFQAYQTEHKLTDREISYYYQKYLSLNSNMGMLKQNYPTTPAEAFTYSGFKMFDQEKLALQEKYEKTGDVVNSWVFYEPYKPSHVYGLGADVAEGVGQDSSVIQILDFTANPVRQVAEYVSNDIAPDMFAHEIKRGASMYGGCIAAVERNNHGHAVLAILKQIYHNIFKEVRTDEQMDKPTEKLGWHTTSASKPLMMYALNDAINEETIAIASRSTLGELRAYDKNDLTHIHFNPDHTKHWDRVIALAIAWQMRSHAPSRKIPAKIHFKTDKWGRKTIVKSPLQSMFSESE